MAALFSAISSCPFAAAFPHSSSSSSSSSITSTGSGSCRLDSSLSASVSPSCFSSLSASSSSSSSSSSWRRLPCGLLRQPLQVRVDFPLLRFKPARMAGTASAAVAEKSIHDFTVKDIDGKDVPLSTYKGKVLLIVNVASRCGLTTSNYSELAQLYSKFKGQDFEILAFPCNQFGGQEPGSNGQIKEFACSRFKAEYPIFDKIDVNGANTAPVYKFLKSSKSTGLLGTLLGDNVKWNFEKFLVDKNGQVVQRYEPTTSPLQIENDIRKLL